MTNDMISFVERYQLLYEKDPHSKVFAPLAEAYRRMGLVDEAIDLAERGVQEHPHFASGRVALGKCYVQRGKFSEGAEQLKIATDLSPENLLAHQLLAECYTRLKRPTDALMAYKIVLFLNPNDARVAEIVKNLESQIYASSDSKAEPLEFSEEEYAMGPVQDLKAVPEPEVTAAVEAAPLPQSNNFEQELALLDALYQKGDWAKVKELLEEVELKYPNNPIIEKKRNHFNSLTNGNLALAGFISPQVVDIRTKKIEVLQAILRKIEDKQSQH
jgi:tetratricopeptide (TPR) repeat protein